MNWGFTYLTNPTKHVWSQQPAPTLSIFAPRGRSGPEGVVHLCSELTTQGLRVCLAVAIGSCLGLSWSCQQPHAHLFPPGWWLGFKREPPERSGSSWLLQAWNRLQNTDAFPSRGEVATGEGIQGCREQHMVPHTCNLSTQEAEAGGSQA